MWLLKTVPLIKPENIHFIENHENLINYLPTGAKTEINIVNIDHHHDIIYSESYKDDFISKNNLTCGNWIKFISDNKNLKKYTWICNYNSIDVEEEYSHLLTEKEYLIDFDLELLETPDCLVICQSSAWIPPTYRPLFYTIMNICEYIHNCEFYFEDELYE